ncbi:MAG: HAD family hydrolase [Bacillota bacterium]
MIKNYLFDLDGTLLPLDEEDFIENYMRLIAKKFALLKLNPKTMIAKLWQGTNAMIKNTGDYTNEEVFWNIFCKDTEKSYLKKELENFYQNEFKETFSSTNPSNYASKIINALKDKNKRIILATNPVFPLVATKQRIEWAKLKLTDFEYVSTYENSAFAKPNLEYYRNIIEKLKLDPNETIMIGNDASEDMIASELGIKTYLVTDCLKNNSSVDINKYNHGSLSDLYRIIKSDNL